MGLWEWLNGTDTQQAVNRNDLTYARGQLDRVSRRDQTDDTDDFRFWNSRVAEARTRTSWWDWFIGDDSVGG